MRHEKYTTSFYGSREVLDSADGRSSSFLLPSAPAPATSREVSQFMKTERYVQEMRNNLGLLDRFRYDREKEQIIRGKLKEIVADLLEAQKQQLISKLALELDIVKKEAFNRYMEINAELEKELARVSTDYEVQLVEFLLETDKQYAKRKKAHIQSLQHDRASGEIDEEDYEREAERIEKWSMLGRNNLEAKVELMLRNHAKQIERTLQIFHERNINGPR